MSEYIKGKIKYVFIKLFKNIKPFAYILIAVSTFLLATMLLLIFFTESAVMDVSTVKKLYYVDNISTTHQKLIDLFNLKNRNNIEVVPINLPFEKFSTNERKELLIRYLRSKNDIIDIFSVDHIWLPRFTKWAEPLGRFYSINERERIIPTAMKTCIYNEKLFALPLYIDVGVLYYRKDIINKLPDAGKIIDRLNNFITWEEMIALGKRKELKDYPFYIFQAENFEGLMCSFIELTSSQQMEIFQNDSLVLNKPEVYKSIQFLFDLINEYNFSPKNVLHFKETESYNYFIENDAVFLRGWPGLENNVKQKTGNKFDVNNIVKTATPHFEGSSPSSIIGGWNLMISKYSRNKQEAVQFINFLLSKEAQEILFREGYYIPIINEIYEDTSFIAEYPDLKFYKKLLNNGVRRPFIEEYTRYSDVISHYINLALKDEIEIEKATKTATQVINSKGLMLK